MHEVGIMESAMDLVRRYAGEQGATRVHVIALRIGALSGVEPEALRFAFDVVTRGTLADGATLEIEPVPARVHCRACEEDFEVEEGFVFECPRCGLLSNDIRQGRELELGRLEVS